MALQSLVHPNFAPLEYQTSSYNNLVIDASGERVAFVFRVPKTGNITHIGFRISTVTTSQSLDIALETLTAGDPSGTNYGGSTPGTQAVVASNTWYEVALGTQASATIGDDIAVVIDFTSTIGNLQVTGGLAISSLFPYTDHFTASWARGSVIPNFAIKYDDGSYPLVNAVPSSAITSTTFGSGTAVDERANRFSVPYETECWGITAMVGCSNSSSNFELRLYSGTTVVASEAFSAANISGTGAVRRIWAKFATGVAINANTVYRVSLIPTSTNSVIITQLDFASNAILEAMPYGTGFYLSTRADAGAWSDTNTSRLNIYPIFSKFSDVISSSGFVPMHSE